MIIKETAIILHRMPFSETSLILKCVGQQSGPVSILAKGALRPKNSLAHTLEALNHCELTYIHKETRDLQVLKEAQVIQHYSELRTDLVKNAYAHVLAELMLRCYTHATDPDLFFALIERYLRLLNTTDLKPPRSQYVLIRFLHDFCDIMGFGLQLHHCIQCGMILDNTPAVISPNLGGAVCGECHNLDMDQSHLFKILFEMGRKNLLPLSPNDLDKLEEFYIRYLCLQLHQDIKLNSLSFLQDVRN